MGEFSKGLSGCKIEVIGDNVRKSAFRKEEIKALRQEILHFEVLSNTVMDIGRFKMPKILEVNSCPLSVDYTIQKINGSDLSRADSISKNQEDIIIDYFLNSKGQHKWSGFRGACLREAFELDHSCHLYNLFRESLDQCSDDFIMDIGYHGDMGFANIISSNDDLYLIDPTPWGVSSRLTDLVTMELSIFDKPHSWRNELINQIKREKKYSTHHFKCIKLLKLLGYYSRSTSARARAEIMAMV